MNPKQVEKFLELAGATKVKPSGDNLIACCPFHSDTNRSFSMNVYTGQWCCFSESCGQRGGLFAFLIEGCNYSLSKAKEIASEWGDDWEGRGTEEGWSVDFPSWENRRTSEEHQEPVPERVLGLYDFCPKYMREERKLTKETLQRWEIGYDFEAERVTFPVRDEGSDLIGISKRTVKRGVDPKYLHLGFKRSRVLYGECFCDRDSEVWVTEGQVDALSLWQFGVEYPLSTMSANVGPRQVKRLYRYPTVVLAFDNDRDGRSATRKVGDRLLEMGHRRVYVARTYGMFHDPGDLLQKGGRKSIKSFIELTEPYAEVGLEWLCQR